MTKDLKQEKWNKLLKLIPKFEDIPFVNFVLVAGSIATGDIHEDSDFDLIVGTEPNRIFTVRMLSAFSFQLSGVRRKNSDSKKEAKDKICLNHFVTPSEYKLDPPYNEYWEYLYQNLVPVYGDKKEIKKFFNDNDWAGDISASFDKWIGYEKSASRKFFEFVFSDLPGDLFEKVVKKYQIRRIKKGLDKEKGYKPQIRYNDSEIRFHMDTKRIEDFLNKN